MSILIIVVLIFKFWILIIRRTYTVLNWQMSVIASRLHPCFCAPVTLGPNTVSMTGSWEPCSSNTLHEYGLSPSCMAHIRLSTWKHDIRGSKVDTSLDWVVRKEKNEIVYIVRILFETTIFVTVDDFVDINRGVQKLLNKNKFIFTIQNKFQQAHPGDFLVSGMPGKAGKDGESHSDW